MGAYLHFYLISSGARGSSVNLCAKPNAGSPKLARDRGRTLRRERNGYRGLSRRTKWGCGRPPVPDRVDVAILHSLRREGKGVYAIRRNVFPDLGYVPRGFVTNDPIWAPAVQQTLIGPRRGPDRYVLNGFDLGGPRTRLSIVLGGSAPRAHFPLPGPTLVAHFVTKTRQPHCGTSLWHIAWEVGAGEPDERSHTVSCPSLLFDEPCAAACL